MITDSLLAKVLPPLEWVRANIFMRLSDFINKLVGADNLVVYNILIVMVSLWLANKILGSSYNTLSGRWSYLILITAIIFYVLRFLGTGLLI